jgi:NTP pyrophosphatase (non-canonical NTP hydrolase)
MNAGPVSYRIVDSSRHALDDLSERCHHAAQKWWHDPKTGERLERNKGEMLMLIVSEIAEAMEGERKNLADSHLPQFRSVEVELADALIRIFDYAGAYKLSLGAAFEAKLKYNETREDHSDKARLAPNGKKF